jgi:hypothetical protein
MMMRSCCDESIRDMGGRMKYRAWLERKLQSSVTSRRDNGRRSNAFTSPVDSTVRCVDVTVDLRI